MDKSIKCVPSETGLKMGDLIQAFTFTTNPSNNIEIIRSVTSNILGREYIIQVNSVTLQLHEIYQSMYGGNEVRLLIDESRYFTLSFENIIGEPCEITPWTMEPPYRGNIPKICAYSKDIPWSFPFVLTKQFLMIRM